MNKLDALRAAGRDNVAESMGKARLKILPAGIEPAEAVGPPDRMAGVTREKDAARIPIDRIESDPDQPRREFDPEELGRLAESLRVRGQIQPIRVRWDEGRGAYVILVGERRWRAAKAAGLADLSCVIQQGPLTAEDRLLIQLTENALREDLRPIEQAKAYQALVAARGYTLAELAAELHVAQSTVSRALALLELPATVQVRVEGGDIAPSVAYEISRAHPEDQEGLAVRVVAEDLKREEVAREVKRAVRGVRKQAARRVTSRTFRTKVGPRVTVEWARGLSPQTIGDAMQEILEVVGRET